ncbi:ThiF family adenylyltransferase [Poseidonibacter ostreae]|uniref:ThiF family adenylyltransferase n=1 Tax=Poseidonibacter ostreae TaxID=2654171 RepID=A0A6L4WVA6_9BACT|nr:ThiF family adenylyltransferase [Poseidonibacter ostreae]KAB7890297.1 ThiF family adenylyltransferase [Poseidonibacter ostreae]
MSQLQINHSKDILDLINEGFSIEIVNGHIIVKDIPYVNEQKEINKGTLITELTLSGNRTIKPSCHTIKFSGSFPCNKDGKAIEQIRHMSLNENIAGHQINFSFSNKPQNGYDDYFHKINNYINIISSPAASLDENISAKTFKSFVDKSGDEVFQYYDTNSSRAGISNISDKLKSLKIGIVGLGGTGSYILDFVSKTHVKEIHLYDGDDFVTHNAFRAPGAASIEKLSQAPLKVEYFKETYSEMHKNIVTHTDFINSSNVTQLSELDFVFVSIDKGKVKKVIIDYLLDKEIPFIDVGMGIEVVDNKLLGILRTTSYSKKNKEHIGKRISFEDRDDDEYSTNIQIAELNAFNAVMAIIKWKKYFGIYQDFENEEFSSYSINVNMLLGEDNNET